MRIDVLTIFPGMFSAVLGESIIKRAAAKKRVRIILHDLRDFTADKHRKVDDRPFGGGSGMVMNAEPIFNAVSHIISKIKGKRPQVILLSPRGDKLTQRECKALAKRKHLILICGHYEGIDERVRTKLVDREISIGDYILTGGELPAMVLIDSLARLIPGVLGDEGSLRQESFEGGLLEYPQYTRPAVYRGMKVPPVLLSGDHGKIAEWRRHQSERITRKKRPELLKNQGGNKNG